MINKKLIIISVFLCSISLYLIGCNSFKTKKVVEELSGNIVIWSSPEKKELLLYEKNKFIQKNKKVTVNVLSVDDDKIYNQIIEYLATDIKLPDIIQINDNYISGITNKYSNKFWDLTNFIPSVKNNYLPSKLNKVIFKGRTLAMPWDTYPVAVFYRKDIFMNVGIDVESIKTYTEFINAGKIILQATAGKSRLIAINSKGDSALYNIFLNQLRGSYFDKDGKCIVSSDKSLRAIKMIKSIYDSGLAYSYSNNTTFKNAIIDGTIVSIPYDNSLFSSIIKDNGALKGKWGVMNLPAFEAGGNRNAQIDGSSLMLSNNSNSKSITTNPSLEFAKYLTTDKEALNDQISSYGIIPAYILPPTDIKSNNSLDYFGGKKIFNTFMQIAEKSAVSISAPGYKEVDDKVTNAFNHTIFNNGNAKELLTKIENQSNTKGTP